MSVRRPIRRRLIVVTILAGFWVPCLVCSQSIPQIELRGGDKIPIANRPVSGGVDPIRCDGGGNVYLRPVLGRTSPLLIPILRITPDGLDSELFDVSTLKELKDASGFAVNDFVVTKSGRVFELISYETKAGDPLIAVVTFDESDNSASFTRIDSRFSPRQIAVFPSGLYLLSGTRLSTEVSGSKIRQSRSSFTGVFDQQGRLVREVALRDDVKFEDFDSANKTRPSPAAQQAVDLSRAVVADDGNVYLLRNSEQPRVYVVSSGGEVVRSFSITAPGQHDPESSAPSMFYGAGHLAFDFYVPGGEDGRMRLQARVADAQDGHLLWEYVLAKDVFGIPACYDGRTFTFLTVTPDRRMALMKLTPQ